MISKISQDILRKYLTSFFDSGFSGVSSGQKMNMITAEMIAENNSSISNSYVFANHMTIMHINIEVVDIISHRISVDA